jgi:hypothetical protein
MCEAQIVGEYLASLFLHLVKKRACFSSIGDEALSRAPGCAVKDALGDGRHGTVGDAGAIGSQEPEVAGRCGHA